MTQYKIGQNIKVKFHNDFHNSEAIGIAKIIRTDSDYYTVEISPSTRKRVEKKLCPWTDCRCQKISSAHIYATPDIKVLVEY